jgi:hypothetical protein
MEIDNEPRSVRRKTGLRGVFEDLFLADLAALHRCFLHPAAPLCFTIDQRVKQLPSFNPERLAKLARGFDHARYVSVSTVDKPYTERHYSITKRAWGCAKTTCVRLDWKYKAQHSPRNPLNGPGIERYGASF